MSAEIWRRIVEPYRTVAHDLGFRLLEERLNDFKESVSCIDLYYRTDGTYLDLVGTVLIDGTPPGVAPGFNFLQMRTFVREGGRVHEVYSVGVPDPQPRAFGVNAAIARSLVFIINRFIKDPSIRMRKAADLACVEASHREQLGTRMPITGEGGPLELRWALQDEMSTEDENP